MNFEAAEKLIERVPLKEAVVYERYFDSIRPKTPEDIFRRGLFAFASVHTTWESNIKLYARLWDLGWMHDSSKLRERIIESKAGLVNGRTKAIMKFTALYWQFPDIVARKPNETWYAYRDRLESMILGLGPAKSAFFIELMHFHDSRISCFDTHMLQTYGVKPPDVGSVKPAELARLEMHWDLTCAKYGLNPVTARWWLWDEKQGKKDSRYWSYVLEGEPIINDPQMELFVGNKSGG
jgi:thermostable 8-oxoguanine DNA glycosylase